MESKLTQVNLVELMDEECARVAAMYGATMLVIKAIRKLKDVK